MPKIRVTITLDPDLWRRAKRIARERGISASALIQEAIERWPEPDIEERIAAVKELAAMDLPVGTPEEMEEEIRRGRLMCLDECLGTDL